MSYTKYIVLLVLLLSGCAQHPQKRPPGYVPEISKSDRAYFARAISFLENNKIAEAEALFKQLADDNPELAGPWVNLGLIYFNTNLHTKSEHAANTALTLNPENPYALNLSGMLANKKGNIKRAHDLYTKAIQSKNDYAIAHYNLALLYDIYYQDTKTASRHYRRYLSLVGGNDKQTIDWLQQIKSSGNKS